MELKDTVSLMTSEDYKERFQAEYHQLKTRFLKLRDMLQLGELGILKFEPACPHSVLSMQVRAMSDYLAILDARAAIEGISVEE